jgi:single-strand DNA-binding protein
MLNRICLVGRLTKDPELRYTGNGTPVCNFRIACERNYTNKNGNKDVDFINIVTWRGLAETCAKYLEKGRLVSIDGSLQMNKSEKNNQTYINAEVNADNVNFLDFGNKEKLSVSDQHKERVEKTLKREEQDQEFDDNFNADDFDVPF